MFKKKDMFGYPAFNSHDPAYTTYWRRRNFDALNAFQVQRIAMTVANMQPHASVLDIGCGGGRILEEISKRIAVQKLYGMEISPDAAQAARKRGVSVIDGDITKPQTLRVPEVNYILMFEIL